MYEAKEMGLRVKIAREQRAKKTNRPFTQKMLAAKIGETSKWVKKVERGEFYPDWDSLSLMVDICGVNIAFVLGEDFSNRSQYEDALRGGEVSRTIDSRDMTAAYIDF